MFFNIKERRIVLNRPVQLKDSDFDNDHLKITYKPNQPGLPSQLPQTWKSRLASEHQHQIKDFSKRESKGYNGNLKKYMNEFVFSTLHRPEWLQELELKMNEEITAEMNKLATKTINDYFVKGQYKEHVTIQVSNDNCKVHYTFNIPIHWYKDTTPNDSKFAVASSKNEGFPIGYCFLDFEIDQYCS